MHVKWLGSGESVSLECDRQYLMSCGLKAQHSPYCNYCNYHPPPLANGPGQDSSFPKWVSIVSVVPPQEDSATRPYK